MPELVEKYKELTKEKEALDAKVEAAGNALALELCPYKVGEVVKVKGYSFRGRSCRITNIYLKTGWKGDVEWAVRGILLKKDGTDAKNAVGWDSWNDKNQ